MLLYTKTTHYRYSDFRNITLKPVHITAFVIMCLIAIGCADAKADDSIPTTTLKELVVEGENAWVEDGKAIFVPTKKEKKFANSPASLISNMNIPMLREKNGTVTTISGQAITYFINGVRAEGIDLATFLAKDAIRLEYMESPKDPRFEGCKYVVNIIMTEYKIGGVTAINATQNIPNSGIYNLSSKLQHDKMTYGARVYSMYNRDHLGGKDNTTTYRNLFYNGVHYDSISNIANQHNYSRSESLMATVNARYQTKNLVATHTIGYAWSLNPWSGYDSSDSWTPNLFNSKSSQSASFNRSITPSIDGNYRYTFSKKFWLAGSWSYMFGKTFAKSKFQMPEYNPISTSSTEKAQSASITLKPVWKVTDHLTLQLGTYAGFSRYDVSYSGSTSESYIQDRNEINASATIQWAPSNAFWVALVPGVQTTGWRINNMSDHNIRPIATAMMGWYPSRKIYIGAYMTRFQSELSASDVSPVTIRQSELLWVTGNPNLKSPEYWTGSFSASYFANKYLRFATDVTLLYNKNQFISTYKPNDISVGGLTRFDTNASSDLSVLVSPTADISLFDSNLSISLQPQYGFYTCQGPYACRKHVVRANVYARYRIGAFQLTGYYDSPYHDYAAGGTIETYNPQGFSLGAEYVIGDLNLKMSVRNPFNERQKTWTRDNNDLVSSVGNTYNIGRQLCISVSYIFGYGKKIDRNIDIQQGSTIGSSLRN